MTFKIFPVRPEQGEHLAPVHGEVKAFEHVHRSISHAQVANFDHHAFTHRSGPVPHPHAHSATFSDVYLDT